MGIEPTAQAWEAWVLPLYDARYTSIVIMSPWDLQTALRQRYRRWGVGSPNQRQSPIGGALLARSLGGSGPRRVLLIMQS
jgi:hypothetical protein